MQATFERADGHWERKKYFEFYYRRIRCRYNLCADIGITALLEEKKRLGLKFYPVFLYVVMRAVNQNREFRMGFDPQGRPGFWNYVNPSYTVFHDDDKTFSDIWSGYDEDCSVFYYNVCRDMQVYGHLKGIKVREGQPANFCPVSAVPWLDFTAFAQDTCADPIFLFPLIRSGRFTKKEGNVRLPLSVFVYHAQADGYHTCKLINDIRDLCLEPHVWMR